jgi:hypothetical protein
MAMPQEDHDLLIELGTEMRAVRSDIKELKDGTYPRIVALEKDKLDKTEFDKLQRRVASMEESRQAYFITMGLFTAACVTMIGLILFHIFKQ